MSGTTKVKISGKRGSVTVNVAEGATVGDVLNDAIKTLGLTGFEPATAVVDGKPAELNDPAPTDAAEIKGVPAARLG